MNAVSPFSLFDTLSPGKVLGRIAGSIAGGIAEQAEGQKGLAGAFSEAWNGLDANGDGALNAKDVLGHAVGARNAVLQGIADTFDYPTDPASRALREGASALAEGGEALASQMGRRPASEIIQSAMPAAQLMIASAPPALPSDPAARALENLPGIDEIRATYATMRSWH